MTGAGATVLVAGLGAGAVWWAGYPSAAWLAVVAALLWVPALAWRLLPRRTADIVLDVPERVVRGDDVRFRVTSAAIRGTTRLTGVILGQPVDRPVRGGAAALTVAAATRGVLRSDLDRVASVGPFGLVVRRQPTPAPVETLVLPRRHPLATPRPAALVADDGPAGTRRGGTEFDGLREYALGDDPRTISWAASARTPDGSLMVRQNVLARSSGYHVILDTAADDPDAFETAVDLAYSVVWTVHRTPGQHIVVSAGNGQATGLADAERLLATVRRSGPTAVPRARGPRTLTRLLITASSGPVPVDRLVVFRVGPAAPMRRTHLATVFTVPDLVAAARAWSRLVRA
jgi:uncharacterized protein (DUF58 family)